MSHFEGTEKLLEVWFQEIDDEKAAVTVSDLRTIPRNELDELMAIVKCTIISECSDEYQHAYILSESSMFISKRRFILKTCGNTQLLKAINILLEMAKRHCHLQVEDIFYSRKNFFRPDLQDAPHQRFEDEVKHLDGIFDCGAAYVLGRLNGECWYLYTLDKNNVVQQPDQTLEILMTDLDQSIMKVFQNTDGKDAKEITKISGIENILMPGCRTDEKLFLPCGYSMNGLVPDNGGYITIHVTPEDEFSYVSFESNVDVDNYSDLVNKVITTFRPGKFVMTLFANQHARCGSSLNVLKDTLLSNYRRVDRQYSQFPCYDLTFDHYVRDDSGTSTKQFDAIT